MNKDNSSSERERERERERAKPAENVALLKTFLTV